MASAAAYLRGDAVFICPYHEVADGPNVAGHPVIVLLADAPDAQLGAAIELALESPRTDLASTHDAARQLARAAGVRGQGEFVRGAEAVSIRASDGVVRVTPMRNRGPREGFDYLLDDQVVLQAPSPEALGAAARAAWPSAPQGGGGDGEPQLVDDVRRSAEWIAEALTSSGYRADFSPASLAEVERFFDEQLRRPGKPRRGGLLAEDLGVRIFALGGYVGEVARRALGGRWDASGVSDDDEDEVRLRLDDGGVVWPVQRVMKRYERGPEESLTAWGASLGVR